MTELEKDLNAIDAEAAECLLDIYPGWHVKYVAARLAELGYVKVVRCGECVYEKHCLQRIHNRAIGLAEDLDYCSEGKRVVAKNATGEEVRNA